MIHQATLHDTNTGLPIHLPTRVREQELQEWILVNKPEVFEIYPDLRELAIYILSFDSHENFEHALLHGKLGPVSDRDSVDYIDHLLSVDPKKGERLKYLFYQSYAEKKRTCLNQRLGQLDLIHSKSNTDPLTAQQATLPLETELKRLREFKYKAETGVKREFPRSQYLDDFGHDTEYGRGFKYDCEVGELFGYKPEDILVCGLNTYLPKGIVKRANLNHASDGSKIEVLDWAFIQNFYENIVAWNKQYNCLM